MRATLLLALPLFPSHALNGPYDNGLIQGRLEAAPAPYNTLVDYVVREGLGGRIQAMVSDPRRRVTGLLPQDCWVLMRVTGRVEEARPIPFGLLEEVYPNNGYPPALPWIGILPGEHAGRYSSVLNGIEPFPLAFTGFGLDSDRDGVLDTQDDFPYDPNEWVDTDGDGQGNNADPDDDNDGMPDAYENDNQLNPLVDDSQGDKDMDGRTNYHEFVTGTLANDAQSFFQLWGALDPTSGPALTLSWPARTGRLYRVEMRTDPSQAFLPASSNLTVQIDGELIHPFPQLPEAGQLRLRIDLQSP